MKEISMERQHAMARTLKAAGLKLTPQRLAIVRVLAASAEHPSVDDLCARLRKDFPGISPATVYRNVTLIKSLGEAVEIAFAGSGSRYDGRKPYPHPHIVCLECGRIIDPKLDSLRNMTREVADGSGFEILSYRLDFFGRCPACRKATSPVAKKQDQKKRRKI